MEEREATAANQRKDSKDSWEEIEEPEDKGWTTPASPGEKETAASSSWEATEPKEEEK